MEQKPDWNYTYIDCLGQQIAIHKTSGILYTEDKTRYSKPEADLLQKINFQLPKSVHLIKKIFGGTLIELS